MLITLAGMTISAILLHPAKHDAGISVIPTSMVTDFKVLEHGANCDVPVNLTNPFNVRFSSLESCPVPPVPSIVPPRIIKFLQFGILIPDEPIMEFVLPISTLFIIAEEKAPGDSKANDSGKATLSND